MTRKATAGRLRLLQMPLRRTYTSLSIKTSQLQLKDPSETGIAKQ